MGGVIGAGIFSLAGAVANEKAGPGVLPSFLIAGIASAAAAFSYAESAGMSPKAGSTYTYGYAVLGEVVGWFIGWDLLLEYTAIVAVVAISISGYFNELLGFLNLELPLWMTGAPGTEPETVPPGSYKVNLFAVLMCPFIAFILNQGMRNAARFETLLVYLKISVVLLVVARRRILHQHRQLRPAPAVQDRWCYHRGRHGILRGLGYDAMSTAAEESQDAQKHMPKAIILSLAVAMVLYVLACLVLTA